LIGEPGVLNLGTIDYLPMKSGHRFIKKENARFSRNAANQISSFTLPVES
jgi:hypothetical protein